MKYPEFYPLKVVKKQWLTKDALLLEMLPPPGVPGFTQYRAGQYLTVLLGDAARRQRDYSLTSLPGDPTLNLAVKVNSESGRWLANHLSEGDVLPCALPKGRFVLKSKPAEFRTILAFAAGIGITPIFSQIKFLLKTEPRTRIFLFYANRRREDVVFHKDLENLKTHHPERLHLHYIFSQDTATPLFSGRLTRKKIELIINQILHTDDTDEESTLWDSVDEVSICGPGEMIREVANACYENGIPKENIHFELFGEFAGDIYPQTVTTPLVRDISVEVLVSGKTFQATLPDNRHKLLQALLDLELPLPYSCKSGVCGTCLCTVELGETEQLENEYLTPRELAENKILPCMAVALSRDLRLNFNR